MVRTTSRPDKAGNLISAPNVREVPLGELRLDGGTQMRAEINQAVVEEYAADIDAILQRTPAVAMDDGENLWLVGGFHRYHACRQAGRETIRCEVEQGTLHDGIVFALGDNARHGLPRTSADKRKAVLAAIQLNEAEGLNWSDRQITRLCSVGPTYIQNMRRAESELLDSSNSDSARRMLPNTPTTDPDFYIAPPEPSTSPAREVASAKKGDFAFMSEPKPEGKEEPVPDLDGVVKDALGNPVEGLAAECFARVDACKEVEQLLRQAAEKIDAIASLPGMEVYRVKLQLETKGAVSRFRCLDLKKATIKVHDSQPYAAFCPNCNGDGQHGNRDDCGWCKGRPYLDRHLYGRVKEFVALGGKAAS